MRPLLPPERLAFRPEELMLLLGVGRDAAYAIAREIGRRHGRRLVVARDALEKWLAASTHEVQS